MLYSKVLALCLLQVVVAFPGGMPGGFGPGAFGNFKQMGMSHAVLGIGVKAAQNEVKVQLDALKLQVDASVCGDALKITVDGIDTDSKTAFDQCSMKTEMQNLRLQSLGLKQQAAAFKMAKKACKLELDPVACLTEATQGSNNEIASITDNVQTGLTDLLAKSSECVEDVKEDLLDRISDVYDDLLNC